MLAVAPRCELACWECASCPVQMEGSRCSLGGLIGPDRRLERQVGAIVVGLDDNQGACTPSVVAHREPTRLMNRKCHGQG